jgi:sugar/nucleoside kinase (ribokinase family)
MESRQFDVVVVGELNPDLILSGDVSPEFGQKEKLISSAVLAIGSSSAIFACGAARLGLRVAFIGKVGVDLFGRYIYQSLNERAIDTKGIVEDLETTTGISIILSRGIDRAILTYPGTISRLKYTDINQDIILRSRHLHIGSYFLLEELRPKLPKLVDLAHQFGLSVSLDTNYDPSEKWQDGVFQLLEKVDVFLPNEVECEHISGKSDLNQAVDVLRTKVKYLAVKQGQKGAFLCFGSKVFRAKTIPVVVVDSVGAGDSFDAGFIYGYLAAWEPAQILKFATICGSLSTQKSGGTAAQSTLEEASSYL